MLRLGDVISLEKTQKIKIQDEIEYTIAGVQSYGKGVVNKRKEFGRNLTMKQYQLIEANQLMWCKVDTKNGAFGITKKEHIDSLASTNMCLAKIDTNRILPEFLEKLFRIKFFHENITHLSSGTTNRKYLTPNQLCEQISIPDFTIKEQKDFLEFVNNLENSPIFSHIETQLTLLENLNQAILQEAVQGKLVKQDPNDEPASELLKRIKEEKALRQAQGSKKNKELPPIKPEEIPFEIPENWVWCRLGEICTKITDGTHHSPINSAVGSYKYVTAKNIKDNGIELSNITYVNEKTHKEIYSRCNPTEGDILYIKDGATTGIVTINQLKEEFSMLSSVALLKLPRLISNKYIMYAMRSPFFYKATRDGMYGVAITRVTLQKIKNLFIPLPPLSEQKRIVVEIEKQFALTQQLKEKVLANQQATEQLLKALLHQAFEVEETKIT